MSTKSVTKTGYNCVTNLCLKTRFLRDKLVLYTLLGFPLLSLFLSQLDPHCPAASPTLRSCSVLSLKHAFQRDKNVLGICHTFIHFVMRKLAQNIANLFSITFLLK